MVRQAQMVPRQAAAKEPALPGHRLCRATGGTPLRESADGASGVGHRCISPRLRTMDISMPSATPRVTIAVPP
jgi:hypothetical protein